MLHDGRATVVTDPLSKSRRYSYTVRGQVEHVWGDTEYPLAFTYDEFGNTSTMSTFRGGTGWTGTSWPTATTGTADITTWHYNQYTGLLDSKEYADETGPSYTYDAAGRMDTRTWARTVAAAALTTTYGYDPDTGQLTSVDYSDSTADLGFTYYRSGRTHTVTDVTGTRTFSYDGLGKLESEVFPSGWYNSGTHLDPSYDSLGRYSGYSLYNGGVVADTATHGFDATDRYNTVVSGSATFTYGYVANTDLLHTLSGPASMLRTLSYETTRNALSSVTNTVSGTTVSSFGYTHDEAYRRTHTTFSGTAFPAAVFNQYAHNDRAEVTAAAQYQGADITNTDTPVATYDFGFAYDNIGNRQTSDTAETGTTVTKTYTPDELNQYTSIVQSGTPPITITPDHDDDGNQTTLDNETGSWTLSWDAENRLSQAVRSVTDGETTTITKLEFQYDYQSRRVEKSKSESTNDGTTWTLLSARRFLYDGWTLIAEFDAASGTPALDRTHLWGTDLSGTLEDAGGIGGLLRTRIYDTTGSADYYPTYDANGNVSEYVDSSGTVVAHYEYSPFGKTTAATGDEADTFAFRFSTKYLDSETALYYYGYRYYDPEDGRWLSRDPLGEMGGANIRAFVTNNAYDLYDSLGEDVRVTGKGRNSKKTEKEILHVVDTQVIPRLESILKSPDLDHKNRKKLEKMLETLKDRPIPEPKIRTRKELKKDFKNNREAMKRAHIEDRANHKAWEEKESARESKCTRLLISDDITVDLADFAANQPYVRMNWKQVKSLDDNLKDGEPFSTSSVVFHELVEQYLKVNRGVKVYKIAHAEAVDLEGIFSGWKRLEEFSDGINTMTNDNKGMVPYRKGKMGIEVHIEICGGKVKIDRKPVTIPPKEE